MIPWSIRNFLELALRASGANEEQLRQTTFGGTTGFDLTTWESGKKQHPRKRHDLETLDLVVCHVSAVTGGFGVTKRAVKRWRKLLDAGAILHGKELPIEILEALPIGENEDRARRLALWERYRNIPYHQIGAGNGDSIANHSLDLWTYHGNTGNKGVGWALDCGADQDLDDWLVETGRASLRGLIQRIDPTCQRPIRVAHHRAFSAGRRGDTGRNVHREVILPVVESLDHVRIDYEIHGNKGRPVPDRWDDAALYDWKGRRIT